MGNEFIAILRKEPWDACPNCIIARWFSQLIQLHDRQEALRRAPGEQAAHLEQMDATLEALTRKAAKLFATSYENTPDEDSLPCPGSEHRASDGRIPQCGVSPMFGGTMPKILQCSEPQNHV